jgi:hypothetical protein
VHQKFVTRWKRVGYVILCTNSMAINVACRHTEHNRLTCIHTGRKPIETLIKFSNIYFIYLFQTKISKSLLCTPEHYSNLIANQYQSKLDTLMESSGTLNTGWEIQITGNWEFISVTMVIFVDNGKQVEFITSDLLPW